MKDGFIRIAAASPEIKVTDCEFNKNNIISMIKEADQNDASLIVFPELCVTAYTCGDLFLQTKLIDEAKKSIIEIADKTKDKDIISVVGFPLSENYKLYNCAAVILKGKILAIIPKENIPSYAEFYEGRHFTPFNKENGKFIDFYGEKVFFGRSLIKAVNFDKFIFSAEICEDLWVPYSPSQELAVEGATVMLNLSAGNETVGKSEFRKDLVSMQSAKLICAYAYASAGQGESTTDVVFSGDCMICENGKLLKRNKLYESGIIYADVDLQTIEHDRRRMTSFPKPKGNVNVIEITLPKKQLVLKRKYDKNPFLPHGKIEERCEEILSIQSQALAARLKYIKAKKAIIGISGGLDSTLALIVTARAFDILELDRKGIIAVTMPCFGTTDRTRKNAVTLSDCFETTLKEIQIEKAVLQHFKDIGHDPSVRDVTYENSQARERTQILMDLANQENGIVIGTGDLSELALGFATYNGDHMSMYGVNSGVPKTLIRYIIGYEAKIGNEKRKKVLSDILDTPVSPELLPHDNGEISQKTEEIIGPYELHDFYLYYFLRYGMTPEKIYRLAKTAFKEDFDNETILKWLKIFVKRFFSQQFKRSCLPDGIKVGSVSLSPRGDFRMPSDASAEIFLKDIK